ATGNRAKFTYARESGIAGVKAKVYKYSISQEASDWKVDFEGTFIRPAFRGAVWIDPETYRVMRLEREARKLPEDYPMNVVEMTVDYGPVTIAGDEYLLVVKAENLACQRDSWRCARNQIEFRNYRQFTTESSVSTTESTVTFEGEAPKR
ncbi:MAG: hypothetical protein GY953_24550, partial [bacterium]|nr:hypothetical protein [bacterium]